MRELNDYTANLSEKTRLELEKQKKEYKKVAMCISTMSAMDVTTNSTMSAMDVTTNTTKKNKK